MALTLLTALVGCSGGGAEGPDVSRYPQRVPEWLWREPRYAELVSPALRAEVEGELRRVEAMRGWGETPAVLRGERRVARKLAGAFSVGDLAEGAHVVTERGRGLALAVQVDPAFDEPARRTLLKASELFVRYALDEVVIERALAASRGREARADPDADARVLVSRLRAALAARGGEPGLLVISSYTGNAWWGGAKLNFFHDRTYHLSRVRPPRGYLYIRLNADRLRAGEPHGEDAAFWAGKIAHEVLHNLGYTHPRYKDSADRDARTRGTRQPLVIAHEAAIRERAK